MKGLANALWLLIGLVLHLSGVVADSPITPGSVWQVSGHNCRINAYCTIQLDEPYSPQADKQGFAMKVTLEPHATGIYELYYPFDPATSTFVNSGVNTIITLKTAPGVWVSSGTQNYNFLLDFSSPNCYGGTWPQGTCSGPLPLDSTDTTTSTTTTTTDQTTTSATTTSSTTTTSPTTTTPSTTTSSSTSETTTTPSTSTTTTTTTTETTTTATTSTVETTTGSTPSDDICAATVSHTGPGYDYEEVLCKSILFYEAQRSGNLDEATNRVPWRGDSTLGDGSDKGVDLTGGWFDAGDFVKFNFPQAVSTSFLAWGFNQWTSAYHTAGQYNTMLDSIRWPLDYFLKCWTTTTGTLYAQVGDGGIDHAYMGRPEDMTVSRPTMLVNSSHPGTDLAAETAAAFAAGSIAFAQNNATYSASLLASAKSLFDFAYYNSNKGKYNDAIPHGTFYSSSGYWDELAWSAAMLYSATNNHTYLILAQQIYNSHLNAQYAWSLDWDSKTLAAAILIFEHTGDTTIRDQLRSFFSAWKSGTHQGNVVTPGGLVWRTQWGSLRHAANVAFAALMSADVGVWDNPSEMRTWAKGQIDYMLGSNPNDRSYVVGFGTNPPTQPHHKSSFCPPDPAPCTWDMFNNVTITNSHTLYGALVGGPGQDDGYDDLRTDYVKNEVACDYNAGFQSALAGIINLLIA